MTNYSRCGVGDKILAPNSETMYIADESTNHIRTAAEAASWSGGQANTYIPVAGSQVTSVTFSDLESGIE